MEKKHLGNLKKKAFICSLVTRGTCNGFPINSYASIFDIENKTLKQGQENVVRWHPKCYSTYTNSANLAYVAVVDTSMVNVPLEDTSKTRSQKPLIDLKSCCMFCGFKKRNNETKLVLLQFEHVIRKIKSVCESIGDNELKRKIGGDFENLPALDARYHSKCYLNYIRQTKQSERFTIHDEAFDVLCDYIYPQLDEGRAIDIPNLLSKYQGILQEKNYQHFSSYSTQRLKVRLIKHYGSSISFTGTQNSRQAMYNSNIKISDAINAAATYKQLVKDKEIMDVEDNDEKVLQRAADILVRDIRRVQGISVNPLDPADVSLDNVNRIIPGKLKQFINNICMAKNVLEKQKKVLSIAQDIVTLQSNGLKKMPKHVGLAISLKSSLRSKEFIRYLNNLGHCI